MLKYTLKRLLVFIPMIIAISLIAFVVSINAPGDPVETLSKAAGNEGGAEKQSGTAKSVKQKLRKKLGLDLPLFYFSVTDMASCDTLYKVQDRNQRENLETLIHQFGNWPAVDNYYKSLLNLQKTQQSIDIKLMCEKDTTLDKNIVNEDLNQIGFNIISLLEENKKVLVDAKYDNLDKLISGDTYFPSLVTPYNFVLSEKENLTKESTIWKTYIPSINWYGINSQYHWWLFGDLFHSKKAERKGIIRGDFGVSYKDSQPIKDKIWNKVGISFTLSLLSILIAYLISIPVGIYSAYKKDSKADKGMALVLFILYSLPSFFVGTVLLLFFANPDILLWFPESGIKDPITFNTKWGIFNWERIQHQMPYLVLPLFTYTYGSFAFLSRIMRVGMIDVVSQDYIRTARAKGLSERTVILKHALRNSLLPIITVFASIFPMSVGGSIIIEVIFSIPGMGTEMYNALLNYDYPMITAFFTLIGFLTMVGYLVADLLYAVVDPRISYK
ncbi:MAG: ABC transporter permease [Flavobacteriales bacterium]|nr:ABC transporter permease [Flavobacteriales bacterium]